MEDCMETFKVTRDHLHALNAHHMETQDKVKDLEEMLPLWPIVPTPQ